MNKKDLLVSFFFLAVSALIFLPMFISDKLFSWLDFMYYFMPFRELTADIIKNGQVPLWNPYIFCGNPLMANMQSAVFYPLNVLYYVLPFTAAVKVQTLLAFFIASFSMYALVRSYKTSRLAAMLAGSVFAFGFYLTVRAVEMADLHVIIWMPAIILMARKYAVSANKSALFLTALSLAMSFLGGHPQVFSYAFILFTAFYFFEALSAGIKIRESVKKYVLVNALFAVFILVQLAPAIEFILNSNRAAEGVGAGVHLSTFAGIEQALAFFFPFLAQRQGRNALFIDWMALIDIGIPAVILFIAGAALMKKCGFKTLLMWLFAGAAVIAFAGNFKLYEAFLKAFPMLGAIEYVSKINIICLVIIALLSAFGFDVLIHTKAAGRGNVIKVVLLAACVSAFAWLLLFIFRKAAENYYSGIFSGQSAAGGYGGFFRDFSVYVLLLISFSLVMLLLALKKINTKTAGPLVFGIAFAAIFSYHTAGYDFYAKQWAFFDDTENTSKLKKDPGIYETRILAPYLYERPDYSVMADNNEASVYYLKDSLLPNIPMQLRLFNADGFDSLRIASFGRLTAGIRGLTDPWMSPAFSLLSAGYVISKAELPGKNMELVASSFTNIYKYRKAMPFAFFIPAGKGLLYSDNAKEVLAGMMTDDFEPATKAYLEKNASLHFSPLASGTGKAEAKLRWENTNTCLINIDTQSDGAVIITDNYYPGWIANVNGAKTPVFRANHTFKAVAVKKGSNEIRLKYDPDLFKMSLGLSVLGLVLAIGYFGYRNITYPHKVS